MTGLIYCIVPKMQTKIGRRPAVAAAAVGAACSGGPKPFPFCSHPLPRRLFALAGNNLLQKRGGTNGGNPL
jgi:hypothetical protein